MQIRYTCKIERQTWNKGKPACSLILHMRRELIAGNEENMHAISTTSKLSINAQAHIYQIDVTDVLMEAFEPTHMHMCKHGRWTHLGWMKGVILSSYCARIRWLRYARIRRRPIYRRRRIDESAGKKIQWRGLARASSFEAKNVTRKFRRTRIRGKQCVSMVTVIPQINGILLHL